MEKLLNAVEGIELGGINIVDLPGTRFTFREIHEVEPSCLSKQTLKPQCTSECISEPLTFDWDQIRSLAFGRKSIGLGRASTSSELASPALRCGMPLVGEAAARQTEQHPCLQHSLTLSFGRRATDNQPVGRTWTFGELISEWSDPDTMRGTLTADEYHKLDKGIPAEKTVRDKEKDGKYFIPASFIGDGRRCIENVGNLYGFALDFDSGMTTRKKIRECLEGYAYAAYASYSFLPSCEKWRVFVPYRQPITAERHRAVYDHFQALFDGDVDPHCATACQLWYTPSCPPDARDAYETFYEVGEFFDAHALLDPAADRGLDTAVITRIATSPTHEDVPGRLKDALQHIDSDDRKLWVDIGLAIHHELGDAGLPIWLEWSERSPKFDEEVDRATWKSFKERESGPRITVASIFFKARQNGWRGSERDRLPDHIAKLNSDHFVAIQGGKTLVFKECVDPHTGERTIRAMSVGGFKDYFMNRFVTVEGAPGKSKQVTEADSWLKHRYRRTYEGIMLAPNKSADGYYNLWRGFAVEPRSGSWQLMREHIRVILCKGDAVVFEYVLNWLAHCVQNPDKQGEVAIVIQGGRGTGKGMFVRAFGELFGKHFKQISQAGHLTGHFNAHLADCLVLFVDEAYWAGDKQGEAVLKHLITEPRLAIERKGLDVEMVPNMLHILMASNSQWVVPAGLDERRFLVLEVDGTKKDQTYFAALASELASGGREAMLCDLQRRDITHFNVRAVPRTKALGSQKLLSLQPHERWWFEKLVSGHFLGHDGTWGQIPKQQLHYDYVEILEKTGVSRKSTETELGMRLRDLFPDGTLRSSRIVDTSRPGQPRSIPVYEFPSLDICRKHFEDIAGLTGFDWDQAEVGHSGGRGGTFPTFCTFSKKSAGISVSTDWIPQHVDLRLVKV